MSIAASIDKFRTLLSQASIPAHEIKVFGLVNVNIHITTESNGAADRWHRVVRKFASRVRIIETTILAADNKGSVMRPTRRKAWRVSAVV